MKKLFLLLAIVALATNFANAQQTSGPGEDPCYCTFRYPNGTYCNKKAVDCVFNRCLQHYFIPITKSEEKQGGSTSIEYLPGLLSLPVAVNEKTGSKCYCQMPVPTGGLCNNLVKCPGIYCLLHNFIPAEFSEICPEPAEE